MKDEAHAAVDARTHARESGPSGRGRTQRVHVAVDLSNVHFGAQMEQSAMGGAAVRNPAVRLRVAQLASLLVSDPTSGDDREVVERWGATAGGPARDSLAGLWEQQAYTIRRLNPDAAGRETGIDMTIHAVVLNWLATRQYPSSVQPVLVLVTGDGNDNGGNATTFPDIVEAAVRNSWHVEIYSWRAATNRRLMALAGEYESVDLFYLDRWREELTYVQNRAMAAATAAPAAASAAALAVAPAAAASRSPPAAASHTPSTNPVQREPHNPEPHNLEQRNRGQMPICRNWPNCPYGHRCIFRHPSPPTPAPRAPVPPSPAAPAPPAATRPPAAPMTTPPASTPRPEDERICVVCLENPSNTVLLPCGHANFCAGCAAEVHRDCCPLCRQRVTGVHRIYL